MGCEGRGTENMRRGVGRRRMEGERKKREEDRGRSVGGVKEGGSE